MLQPPSANTLPVVRSPTKISFNIPANPNPPPRPLTKSATSILTASYSPLSRYSPFRQPTYWADLFIIAATCALAGFRTAPLLLACSVPCVAHLSLSFGDRTPADKGFRRRGIMASWMVIHLCLHLALALTDRYVSRRFAISTVPRDTFLIVVLACAVAVRLYFYYILRETTPTISVVPPVQEKLKMSKKPKDSKLMETKEAAEEKRWAQARRRTIVGYESRPSFEPSEKNTSKVPAAPATPKPKAWEPVVRFLGLDFFADSLMASGKMDANVGPVDTKN